MLKMMTANYAFDNLLEQEDFLNSMFIELKQFEVANPDFKFKMNSKNGEIEVKTIKLNEQSN